MPAKAKTTKTVKRSVSGNGVPSPTRVKMPAGYTVQGSKPEFLAWEWVTERLEKAHNYWICSTRPDGRPHAVPVWGVFADGAVVFSTDPTSRKAKNLTANPAITVHLESGDEAVIVEGLARKAKLTRAMDDAYNAKYKMRLSSFPGPVGIYEVKPKIVMAWREKDFPTSNTRWEF